MKTRTHAVAVFSWLMLISSLSAGELRVLLLDAAGMGQETLESVRSQAESELYVPVHAQVDSSIGIGDPETIAQKIAKIRTEKDVGVVAFVTMDAKREVHATIMTNQHMVLVNVTALRSDDPNKFLRRLQKWAMRGTAFLFAIGPDIDPRCVMHDYRTLDELDKLGLNFSPPWAEMFRQAAARRGLDVRPLFPLRKARSK